MSTPELEERRQEIDRIGDVLTGGIQRVQAKRARRKRAVLGGCASLAFAFVAIGGGLAITGNQSADPTAPATAGEVLQEAAKNVDQTPAPLGSLERYYTNSIFNYRYLTKDPATGREFHWNGRVDNEYMVAPGKTVSLLQRLPQPVFPSAADRQVWEQLDKPLIHVTRNGRFEPDDFIHGKQSAGLAPSGSGPWMRLSPATINVDAGVQPRPSGLGEKVVAAYGMDMRKLQERSEDHQAFRSYVLSHVMATTKQLAGPNDTAADTERNADLATFSLVVELYALGGGQLNSALESALLDVGAQLKSLRFGKTVDALGRDGIEVSIAEGRGSKALTAAVFDPESFLLNELRLAPADLSTLGLANEPGKFAKEKNPDLTTSIESLVLDYEYGVAPTSVERPSELGPRTTAPCELRPYC